MTHRKSLYLVRKEAKEESQKRDQEDIDEGRRTAQQINQGNSLAAKLPFKPECLPGLGINKTTPDSYFHDAVTSAISKLGMSVTRWTEFYLVTILMSRVAGKKEEGGPLVFQLAKAREAESPLERLSLYKKVGDSALFLLGFFSDFVENSGLQRRYVSAMGGSAYEGAAELAPKGVDSVYYDLADGFEEFALVLDEVKESTALRTPQDIVKLYDRWRRTKSASAEDRLREHGVFPIGRSDE